MRKELGLYYLLIFFADDIEYAEELRNALLLELTNRMAGAQYESERTVSVKLNALSVNGCFVEIHELKENNHGSLGSYVKIFVNPKAAEATDMICKAYLATEGDEKVIYIGKSPKHLETSEAVRIRRLDLADMTTLANAIVNLVGKDWVYAREFQAAPAMLFPPQRELPLGTPAD